MRKVRIDQFIIGFQWTLLLILLTVATPCLASAVKCADIFRSEEQLVADLIEVNIKSSFVQQWLKFRESEYIFKPRTWIEVNGTKYRVLAELGSGGEGDVFLAISNTRLVVIKKFFDELRYERSSQIYIQQVELLPRVLEKSDQEKTLILEYKEGIPVHWLQLHGEKLGLSREKIQEILNRRVQWAKSNEEALGPFQLGHPDFRVIYNSIYSFHDDQFYLIDPH